MVLPRRYVLLHHVMGELEKEKGAWGYVEGGMGGVSQAIASSARSRGVDIFTEKVMRFRLIILVRGVLFSFFFFFFKHINHVFPLQEVEQVLVDSDGAAKGVVLKDGTEIYSKVVLSNATPYVTFKNLAPRVIKTTCTAHVITAPDSGIYSVPPVFRRRLPFLQSSSKLWIRLTTPHLLPRSMVNLL